MEKNLADLQIMVLYYLYTTNWLENSIKLFNNVKPYVKLFFRWNIR